MFFVASCGFKGLEWDRVRVLYKIRSRTVVRNPLEELTNWRVKSWSRKPSGIVTLEDKSASTEVQAGEVWKGGNHSNSEQKRQGEGTSGRQVSLN